MGLEAVAWAVTGWRLWQYAGDESADRPAYNRTAIVPGVSHWGHRGRPRDWRKLHRTVARCIELHTEAMSATHPYVHAKVDCSLVRCLE